MFPKEPAGDTRSWLHERLAKRDCPEISSASGKMQMGNESASCDGTPIAVVLCDEVVPGAAQTRMPMAHGRCVVEHRATEYVRKSALTYEQGRLQFPRHERVGRQDPV